MGHAYWAPGHELDARSRVDGSADGNRTGAQKPPSSSQTSSRRGFWISIPGMAGGRRKSCRPLACCGSIKCSLKSIPLMADGWDFLHFAKGETEVMAKRVHADPSKRSIDLATYSFPGSIPR